MGFETRRSQGSDGVTHHPRPDTIATGFLTVSAAHRVRAILIRRLRENPGYSAEWVPTRVNWAYACSFFCFPSGRKERQGSS